MGITEIPKSYRYVCDSCGAVHVQEYANGHYHNSTPPDWMTVFLLFNMGNNVERLNCDECAKSVKRWVTEFKGRTPR